MHLTEVRDALAIALAPVANDDPIVYTDLVDAIDVPCLMILWDEPPFEDFTVCNVIAKPVVIAVAGRIEPGETLGVLEGLWSDIITRLRANGKQWGTPGFGSPRVMDIGGISYLASRVVLRVSASFVPVDTGEPPIEPPLEELDPSTATITQLIPRRVTGPTEVQVRGTGYTSETLVLLDGVALPHAFYYSPTQMRVTVDALALGSYTITVQKPGELPSNAKTLTSE